MNYIDGDSQKCGRPVSIAKTGEVWPCELTSNHDGRCRLEKEKVLANAETMTIYQHYKANVDRKHKSHRSYRHQVWFPAWHPKQGGTLEVARQWFKANMPKPGPGYELHVIKTEQYPYGYFGPGGIKWVHRMDRHDKELTELVARWTDEQWAEFKKQENHRRAHNQNPIVWPVKQPRKYGKLPVKEEDPENIYNRLKEKIVSQLQQNNGKISYKGLCKAVDYLAYGTSMWDLTYQLMIKKGLITQSEEPREGKPPIKTVSLVLQS